MARAALTTASIGLLSYVVPVDEAIHDGTLKLLVGLKCQVRCLRSPPFPSIQFNPN